MGCAFTVDDADDSVSAVDSDKEDDDGYCEDCGYPISPDELELGEYKVLASGSDSLRHWMVVDDGSNEDVLLVALNDPLPPNTPRVTLRETNRGDTVVEPVSGLEHPDISDPLPVVDLTQSQ